MNIINVEIYSITILLIIIIDYITKFKNNITTASKLWLVISISALGISISNLMFSHSDLLFFKTFSMVLYFLCIITCSVYIYIYIKYRFINPKINIRKEIIYGLISIIACVFLTIFILFISDSGYVLHSFNRRILNKLLLFSICPNILICAQYIYYESFNNKPLDLKIIATLLLTVIGISIDIIFDSLFFVSQSFTLTCLIIYINRHESLLNTDPLTGLLNRRSIDNFIEHLKPNLNVAVYSIDINRFKLINDTYGHLKGDIVLKDLAKILFESSRNRDLIIRNGGDEFLIIAIIKKKSDASILVKRIDKAISLYNKKAEIKFTISIGYDVFNSSEKFSIEDFNNFFKGIDKKMYAEKEFAHQKEKKQ